MCTRKQELKNLIRAYAALKAEHASLKEQGRLDKALAVGDDVQSAERDIETIIDSIFEQLDHARI